MTLAPCVSSEEACVNYLYNLSGNNIVSTSASHIYKGNCEKGYNYFNKTHFGIVNAVKGTIPFATSAPSFIAIDTSANSKYSDFTFIFMTGNPFNNFKRIDMKRNFRFYVRFYYEDEMQPNMVVFSKNFSNKLIGKTVTATVNLDNGFSRTAYSQISLKSSFKIFIFYNNFIYLNKKFIYFFRLQIQKISKFIF